MLALETKQSGGKLLPTRVSGGGGVSRGSIQQQAIVRVIKSRRMRWAGHVARMGEERGGVQGLSGETGGKETTGRPRRRWVDN